MGNPTLVDKIKTIIGKISFRIFLWSIGMTKENYITMTYELELAYRNSKGQTK